MAMNLNVVKLNVISLNVVTKQIGEIKKKRSDWLIIGIGKIGINTIGRSYGNK